MPIAPLKPADRIFVQFESSECERVLHAALVLETDPERGVRVRLEAGSAIGLDPALASGSAEPGAALDALYASLECSETAAAPAGATGAAVPEPLAGIAAPDPIRAGPEEKLDPRFSEVQSGQSASIFFVWNQRFSRQPGRISEVLAEPRGLCVALIPTGRLASAESRECYRASALAADLWVDLGGDMRCEVIDVSATGFSALVPTELPQGALIDVTLAHAGERVSGRVRVQNTRQTPGGRLRCGFHCIEDPEHNQLLGSALPRINITLQREQLARRAGLDCPSSPPARFTPTRLRG